MKIALKISWFMKNKQLCIETELRYLPAWIKKQFENFHERLNQTEEALYFKIEFSLKQNLL